MNVLNEGIKIAIMGQVSKRFGDIRCRFMSSYHEKILACNAVFCFKCSNEIEIGSEYEKVYSKYTGSKYYHIDCHQSLYL